MTASVSAYGRRFRLRRRGGIWHLDYQAERVRHRQSLHTGDLELARLRAREHLRAWHQSRLDQLQHPNGKSFPFRDFLKKAQLIPLNCLPATRHCYFQALDRVVNRAWGERARQLSLADALSPATVRAYLRLVQDKIAEALTQEHANRLRRSANSTLNQIRSLLAPHHRGHFADAGIPLPDLRPFLDEIAALRFRDTTKRAWYPPDESIIHATLDAWRAAAASDLNLYLAVWLALSCGLRRGEIAQARFNWLHDHQLLGAASVKNRSGEIRVTPLEPYWSEGLEIARALALERAPDAYLLSGSDTERRQAVFRRISRLLRGLGWRSTKTNHALRALSGCLVARERGLHAAAQFLRHSSLTITERHYAWLLPSISGTPTS